MVFSEKVANRYRELKAQQSDCILLMQVGTFMQVMNEDARMAVAVTGLKLQMAGNVEAPVVLGGFPKSGLDAYVGKLVRAGHSVAVAVQDEEKGRGISEVIRLEGERKVRHKMNARFTGLLVVVFGLVCGQALAANIDPAEKYAWSSQAGWVNSSPTHGGMTVVPNGANGYLSGFAWTESVGWVKLGSGTGPYANTGAADWGVNMDASGNLSGYAWSSHFGWINFHPTHGQVSINTATGRFDGYAWGENIGWIHFKNAAPTYNVRTTVYDLIMQVIQGSVYSIR